MGSVFVVITDVVDHQPFEMPFVERDDVIKQVSAAVANPTFGESVLPRTAKTSPLRLDAEAPCRADNVLVEVGAAIEDQTTHPLTIMGGKE